MPARDEFLVFGRRIHTIFRSARVNGDYSKNWYANVELNVHHMCGFYVAGCLSYLEGTYGERCWNKAGVKEADFDNFIQNGGNKNFIKSKVSKEGLEALVCIRNALIHNKGDLSGNRDKDSVKKVLAANIDGVELNGSVVTLNPYPPDGLTGMA